MLAVTALSVAANRQLANTHALAFLTMFLFSYFDGPNPSFEGNCRAFSEHKEQQTFREAQNMLELLVTGTPSCPVALSISNDSDTITIVVNPGQTVASNRALVGTELLAAEYDGYVTTAISQPYGPPLAPPPIYLQGLSGFSGTGSSGLSGFSGQLGISGINGTGVSGTSGFSGQGGISGALGQSGTSGFSGQGESGASGATGGYGWSGLSGTSGTSGTGYFATVPDSRVAWQTGDTGGFGLDQCFTAYEVGSRIRLSNAADQTEFMEGLVTIADHSSFGDVLEAYIDLVNNGSISYGSNPIGNWNVSLAGQQGVSGFSGFPGYPSVTGNSGLSLKTDGITVYWG